MEIREVDNETYNKIVRVPFCRFNKAQFYILNEHKVDNVCYLIFNDGKDRFAFVLGIKDNVAKAPFSASFECFSEITKNNKINHYYEAVDALVNYLKENNISKIEISTPPPYYNISHITKFENALYTKGFSLVNYDVNFEYYLDDFSDDYEMNIDIKARQKLRAATKHHLIFEKTEDVETVYKIIKQNRTEKGYPLWMSYDDVRNTAQIIPSDYFLVKDANNTPIASALVHQINDEVLRVVYWGNIQASNHLCPMNFLSYNVFKYYSTTKFKMVDIGPSTENSIANFGLCDFKEGIGCKCSPKFRFGKEFHKLNKIIDNILSDR